MNSTSKFSALSMTLGLAAAILGGFWLGLGTGWLAPPQSEETVSPRVRGMEPGQSGETQIAELPEICRSWLSAMHGISGPREIFADVGQFGSGPAGKDGATIVACKFRLGSEVLSLTRRRQLSESQAKKDFGEAYTQFQAKFGDAVELEDGGPVRRIWIPQSSMAVNLRGRDSFIAALSPPRAGASKAELFTLLDRISDVPVGE